MSNKEIYTIAEIGNNHQGSVKHAMKLIKSAKDAGANAVKTQKRDNKSLYTKTFLIRFMTILIVLHKLMESIEKS